MTIHIASATRIQKKIIIKEQIRQLDAYFLLRLTSNRMKTSRAKSITIPQPTTKRVN